MSQALYRQLLADLRKLADVDVGEEWFRDGLLRIGAHDVQIAWVEEDISPLIRLSIVLGHAKEAAQAGVWYQMLVTNFFLGSGVQAGLSLTPLDNRAVMTLHYPIHPDTDRADVLRWIAQAVAQADAVWACLQAQQPITGLPLPPQRPAPSTHAIDAHHYGQLLAAFCDHTQLVDREQFLQEGALQVGGINMQLSYDGLQDPSRLDVRVDLGEVPSLNRQQLWQGLLWNNFLLGSQERLLFSLHPEAEHVVMAMRHAIRPEWTASDLAALLSAMADTARGFWTQLQDVLGPAAQRSLCSAATVGGLV